MKREYPENYVGARILKNGRVVGPRCCGQRMADDGDCGQGCCDDYRCEACGFKTRIEWPD